ncbi:hypothetical protein SAY86_028629 [Trapa natans]|uniref:Uncharacterized protein n=1 Tax=Trapa natans TaxID=22666 RepID=A0AAN7LVA2_TRANT|nr:hypothetical protein SAY86_028629 [Trapa natans]
MENSVKSGEPAPAPAPAPPPAGGGGGGDQEVGDGTVQCSEHRFKNTISSTSTSNSGGICAFCLQEKLGKLVSSSLPLQPVLPASCSSSPSPSFRSDVNGVYGGFCNSSVASSSSSSTGKRADSQLSGQRSKSRSRMIPFISSTTKKKKKSSPSDIPSSFKRSKSTTSAPRRGTLLGTHQVEDNSPRSIKIGFWSSIFYITSSSKANDSVKNDRGNRSAKIKGPAASREENNATGQSQRKVSRSRSAGCGSRSFSGDFFERISNGFGDCTLRRVESHREGSRKPSRSEGRRQRAAAHKQESMKERIKCSGIFSGFMLTTSSSSSSSSSSYWVCNDISKGVNSSNNSGRSGGGSNGRGLGRGRGSSSSNWSWAFASPMRAFTRPLKASQITRGEASNRSKKAAAPNLNSIPSLPVRS